ncbi:MAG: cation:proton antiporter [Ignavibacteria bacterium]|nr:cation:proton antiporter [Ignavibacteria bacterium]
MWRRFAFFLAAIGILVLFSSSASPTRDDGSHDPAAGHADPVANVLLAMTVILAGAKIAGALFERFKQPAVLGELVIGVILGNLVLFNPAWDFFGPLRAEDITVNWAVVVDNLSRIGVILLLFEVGLESNIAEMRKVGISSFLVAAVGVIAPFVLGFFVSSAMITEVPPQILAMRPDFDINNIHLFIGATLCATSVGITARVFKDLGKLQTKEAKIVLGAAVIDDVLGLVILAIVAGIIVAAETGRSVDIASLFQIAAIAVGFLIGAIVLGIAFVPRMMKYIAKLQTHGMVLTAALLFCFVLSYLANAAGLAAIVGAFAAGLILDEVHFKEFNEKKTLHDLLLPVTTFLVPIFFVVMGIQVRLETFLHMEVLGLAVGLTVAAFVGKQVCGLAVAERKLDRLSIGLGMVPRGEVGLIFASIGKMLGVVNDAIFSAVVIMVIVTTLITPPFLKMSLARYEKKVGPQAS